MCDLRPVPATVPSYPLAPFNTARRGLDAVQHHPSDHPPLYRLPVQCRHDIAGSASVRYCLALRGFRDAAYWEWLS
jgi:hypothetical protein